MVPVFNNTFLSSLVCFKSHCWDSLVNVRRTEIVKRMLKLAAKEGWYSRQNLSVIESTSQWKSGKFSTLLFHQTTITICVLSVRELLNCAHASFSEAEFASIAQFLHLSSHLLATWSRPVLIWCCSQWLVTTVRQCEVVLPHPNHTPRTLCLCDPTVHCRMW